MKRALLLLLVATTCALAEPVWHVAPPPLGDDAHDGSAATPFATLERARRAVRTWLAAHDQRAELAVELRGGTYELAAPVRFDSSDSGENGFAVVYRAAAGEAVVLSGGRRVRGWTADADGVFRTELGRDIDFRQLWIDGRRAVRARTPNQGRMFTLADEKQPDGFNLPRSQLAGVAFHPGEIELSVPIAWMHKRLRLARLAETGDPALVRAVIAEPEWDAVTKQPQGDRIYRGRDYWLENAREFLDAPGEFFLDRGTGVLRYRPRADETVPTAEVIRPELENLILLDGRLDAPVHHLRFEGLTFAHTGWTRPNRSGFVDVQANSLVPADPASAIDDQYRHRQRKERVPAAFQATTADAIVLRGCRFVHLGGTGVMFTQGGDDNVVEGNAFFDLAAGGIEFGEDAARPTNPRLFPRRNRIANNFLAHLGEDYFGSVAILGYYTDASVIAHNEIGALPYTAISQGWGWGQPPAPPESRANRILGNRISNVMRRVDDGGGIYTTDAQPGSEIAGNVIERVLPPDPHTKAGGAIYLDQFTSGFHVHDNVVAESHRWLYIWNPNIRDNRVVANHADTAAQRNDGTDNVVEPVHLAADRRWPEDARAIISVAGIEPAYASARDFTDERELVFESTGVDFQVLAGDWETVDAPAGGYGGTYRESKAPAAAARARWLLNVPRAGRYEVAAWRPAQSARAAFAIRRGDEQSIVQVPANDAAGWCTLGTFHFAAGFGAEVEIAAGSEAGDRPLRADALRLRRVDVDSP